MSPCDDFRAQLPLFVGGDLEAPLAARLEEHLGGPAGCAACAGVLQELSAVRSRLLELPQLSPAPAVELWAPIRVQLAAEGRIVPAAARRMPQPALAARRAPALWRFASAAAAVALLALGASYFLQGPAEAPSTAPGGGVHGGSLAGEIDSQVPSVGESLALPNQLVQPVGIGGLRRLGPGEQPLSTDPLMRDAQRARELMGWPGWQFGPGMQGQAVDPSHPTLASDRLR
jgi:hypothetical protein